MQARLRRCPPSSFSHLCIAAAQGSSANAPVEAAAPRLSPRLATATLHGQCDAGRHRSGKGQCFCRLVKLALVVCLPLCVLPICPTVHRPLTSAWSPPVALRQDSSKQAMLAGSLLCFASFILNAMRNGMLADKSLPRLGL